MAELPMSKNARGPEKNPITGSLSFFMHWILLALKRILVCLQLFRILRESATWSKGEKSVGFQIEYWKTGIDPMALPEMTE